MNALKASRFNLAVRAGGDQLLFNSATTALLRVDEGTFASLRPLFPDGAEGHRGVPRDYFVAPPADLDPELAGALEEGGSSCRRRSTSSRSCATRSRRRARAPSSRSPSA